VRRRREGLCAIVMTRRLQPWPPQMLHLIVCKSTTKCPLDGVRHGQRSHDQDLTPCENSFTSLWDTSCCLHRQSMKYNPKKHVSVIDYDTYAPGRISLLQLASEQNPVLLALQQDPITSAREWSLYLL
jgi:hypothetical protein